MSKEPTPQPVGTQPKEVVTRIVPLPSQSNNQQQTPNTTSTDQQSLGAAVAPRQSTSTPVQQHQQASSATATTTSTLVNRSPVNVAEPSLPSSSSTATAKAANTNPSIVVASAGVPASTTAPPSNPPLAPAPGPIVTNIPTVHSTTNVLSSPANVAADQPTRSELVSTLLAQLTLSKKDIYDLRCENDALKLQNHHLSLLLDVSMSKLEAMGFSLIPSFTAAETVRHLREARERSGGSSIGNLQRLFLQQDHDATSAIVSGGHHGGHNPTTGKKFRLQHDVKAHSCPILSAVFAPDGEHIATAAFDGSSVLIHATTGNIVAKSAPGSAHDGAASDVSFSNDGKLTVTVGLDGNVITRDVNRELKQLSCFSTPSPLLSPHAADAAGDMAVAGLCCIALPAGDTLFAITDASKQLHLIDPRVSSGLVLHTATADNILTSVCSDGTETSLITGDSSGMIAIWDLRAMSSPLLRVNHISPIRSSADSTSIGMRSPSTESAAPLPDPTTSTFPSANFAVVPRSNDHRFLNGDDGKVTSARCISHISCFHGDDHQQTLLVVSDDSLARLYRRRAMPSATGGGATAAVAAPSVEAQQPHAPGDVSSATPASLSLAPLTTGVVPSSSAASKYRGFMKRCTFSGMTTKSFPIRGAFRPGHEKMSALLLDDDDEASAKKKRLLGDADLVACGSTDRSLHVFQVEKGLTLDSVGGADGDVSSLGTGASMVQQHNEPDSVVTTTTAGDGSTVVTKRSVDRYAPLQRLEHRDVVYGAVFHPMQPVVASFSADATVRIWIPTSKKAVR